MQAKKKNFNDNFFLKWIECDIFKLISGAINIRAGILYISEDVSTSFFER